MALTKAQRERYRETGFPNDPDACLHRRINPVVDLRTLIAVSPLREQCWYCGTTFTPTHPTRTR